MLNRMLNGAAILKPAGCIVQVVLNVMPNGIGIASELDAANVLLVLEKARLAIVNQSPITLPQSPKTG